MEKVNFTFKRGGKTKAVLPAQAKILAQAGLGTYQTRDMASQPRVAPLMNAQTRPVGDGLDAMGKDELHALAKSRGLTLHHLLGADKVRAAIREAV